MIQGFNHLYLFEDFLWLDFAVGCDDGEDCCDCCDGKNENSNAMLFQSVSEH